MLRLRRVWGVWRLLLLRLRVLLLCCKWGARGLIGIYTGAFSVECSVDRSMPFLLVTGERWRLDSVFLPAWSARNAARLLHRPFVLVQRDKHRGNLKSFAYLSTYFNVLILLCITRCRVTIVESTKRASTSLPLGCHHALLGC